MKPSYDSSPVGYSVVHGVLSSPPVKPRTRELVMSRFRDYGGDLNRWSRKDGVSMADAITYTEDQIELESVKRVPPSKERLALRDIRRRLEWWLFP